MKLFSRGETHGSKIKYKIGTVVLSAALIFTSIGGMLTSASALNTEPYSEESVEQTASDTSAANPSAADPSNTESSAGSSAGSSGDSSAGSSASDSADKSPADTDSSDSAAAETKPSDSGSNSGSAGDEAQKPDNTGASETESAEKDAVYTLHLTHYLRFTVDGENRHVQSTQTIKLTEKDFENGKCDLNRFAYDAKQLMVTKAEPVTLDDFDKERQGGASIIYAVNSGWKLVPADESGTKGVALRTVFEGTDVNNYTFIPAKVVTFTVDYQYSKSGGLYGLLPYAPDTIQVLATEVTKGEGANAETEYVFDFPIKSKDGFRIVLNPKHLDKYLIKQPQKTRPLKNFRKCLMMGILMGMLQRIRFMPISKPPIIMRHHLTLL